MSGVRNLEVAPDESELRLDRWFRRRFPTLGRARLEKLLRTGQVRVDGRRAKSGTRLEAGQIVRVPPLAEADAGVRPATRTRPGGPSAADARALREAVLYKDDWAIAIDKPAGLAVQGGTGLRHYLDAMLDALRFDRDEAPRLVHRLDKDTSGVLLLARSLPAARRLTAAFKDKRAHKLYWALVVGCPKPRRGRIDVALGKRLGPAGETVRPGAPAAKPATTLYQVVETRALPAGGQLAWLVLMPLTGRTHQLRAHCAALGTPILGDGKYGGRQAFPGGPLPDGSEMPKRLMLHARELALPHPEDETTLRVEAPLPAHMARAFAGLGLDAAAGEATAHDLLGYAEGQAHSPPGTRPARRRKAGDKKGPRKRGRR
jgi:23S rRNA pseudouridine955/2504/2580 synthase